MLVMVAAYQNSIVMPLIGSEFLDRHFSHHPGLPFGIDDDFFSGVTQYAPSFFFVEHAVVFRDVGDDVALVASDDIKIDFGSRFPAILNAAVPTDPTTGTYGGINRATWTFWRNQASDQLAADGLDSAKIQGYWNALWADCSRGTPMRRIQVVPAAGRQCPELRGCRPAAVTTGFRSVAGER